MPCICKDSCRYEKKASKWTYIKGFHMCTVCSRSIKTEKLRCYCCGSRLRTGAQSNEYRQLRVANAVRFD